MTNPPVDLTDRVAAWLDTQPGWQTENWEDVMIRFFRTLPRQRHTLFCVHSPDCYSVLQDDVRAVAEMMSRANNEPSVVVIIAGCPPTSAFFVQPDRHQFDWWHLPEKEHMH